MRVLFYLLLAFLYIPFGYSQKPVIDLEMKGGKAQEVYSVNDSYGNMAYLFQGTKSFQITILDVNFSISKEFLINRGEAEKKNIIIGATISNENVVMYLYDQKDNSFSSLIVDRNTGTFQFNPSICSLSKTEFLLKSFEMDGAYYLMVVPEHKNEIYLYSSIEGLPFTLKKYDIAFPTFYAALSAGNSQINQGKQNAIGIEKINYVIENDIQSSYSSKKMYTYGNKIYLTFEEPAHTHLIILDPNRPSSIYRKLNFTLDKAKDNTPKKGNSFLFKGDLFRVTLNKDQLNLIVINLDSMQLLKSYTLLPDQNIPIINGLIREDVNGRDPKIIKNTSSYFKKINKGELAVAVNEVSGGNYVAEIGAYEESTEYRSASPMGGGIPLGSNISIGIGIGLGMGGFGMGGPGMGFGGYPGYSPYNNSYNVTTISTSYFQTQLKIEDLSHVPGNIPRSVKDKINEYEEFTLRNNSPEAINILPSYTGIVLGYYAKGRSRYNLVEFLK